jgi:hypothetical protein
MLWMGPGIREDVILEEYIQILSILRGTILALGQNASRNQRFACDFSMLECKRNLTPAIEMASSFKKRSCGVAVASAEANTKQESAIIHVAQMRRH